MERKGYRRGTARNFLHSFPLSSAPVVQSVIFQKTREGCGCPKFFAGKVFRQISTLLENDSLIFRQREMLSLPRFGHFPARQMAAGKPAPPSGTLLDFLLRDRHSLRGHTRCFLNGVFQSGVFRGRSGPGSTEGTKILENTGVCKHSSL